LNSGRDAGNINFGSQSAFSSSGERGEASFVFLENESLYLLCGRHSTYASSSES
jgi:hypothetical protein